MGSNNEAGVTGSVNAVVLLIDPRVLWPFASLVPTETKILYVLMVVVWLSQFSSPFWADYRGYCVNKVSNWVFFASEMYGK